MNIDIGKAFSIIPSSAVEVPRVRTLLVLGPGKAFGSGEHETTRSCLEELEKIPALKGMKVLDIGCGTGILSIAVAKLGAARVTALDNDPDAVETTARNIHLNRLEKRILPLQGELHKVGKETFDLIMANLYGDLILSLAGTMEPLLNAGGYMLLSGIRFEHLFDIKRAFTKRELDRIKTRILDEYCTLVFKKSRTL